MSATTTTLDVECIAPHGSLAAMVGHVTQALARVGIRAGITPRGISAPVTIKDGLDDYSCITVTGVSGPRLGHIRLVCGCVDADGRALEMPLVIGADCRAEANWRAAAFLANSHLSFLSAAVCRLVLDPFYTGALTSAETSPLHRQLVQMRWPDAFPIRHGEEHGRVLLVDVNPVISPAVHSYGLAILSAVSAVNGFLSLITAPFRECVAPERSIVDIVRRFQPSMVGISLRNLDDATAVRTTVGMPDTIDTQSCIEPADKLLSAIRGVFDGPVILGGAALARNPAAIMGALSIRYGVGGAGEAVMDELFRRWRPFEREVINQSFESIWRSIAGTITVGTNSSVRPPAALKTALRVPRDPVDLWLEKLQGVPTALLGSRGCPMACSYCLEATPGQKVQKRSAKTIVDEMEWLHTTYGVNYFHLTDSEVNHPLSRLTLVAREIAERGLDGRFFWDVYSTPTRLKANLLPLLRRAGLRKIKFSVDHFADTQLKQLNKPYDEKKLRGVVPSLLEAAKHFEVSASILFGAPGETQYTIDQTVSSMKELSKQGIGFYYNVGLRLYPGTRLFEQWHNGQIDPADCFGPGVDDGGLSPLFYCAPSPPRTLARLISNALADCPNVRRIATYRQTSSDEAVRLRYVTAGRSLRGDTATAGSLLHTYRREASDEIWEAPSGNRPQKNDLLCSIMAVSGHPRKG